MKLETLAVHAGRDPEPGNGAITPGIHLSTTFERAADGTFPGGHVYTRSSNPNRDALETALAALEGGSHAIAFGSGLAASAALLQTLRPGDHVLLPDDLYHGTRHMAHQLLAPWGLAVTAADLTDPDAVRAALRPETRLVWIETPSNPQLKIADIARIASLAHEAGALCAVDNTWTTAVIQRPLDLGADIVLYSTTKYIGGHSDVLGGCLVLSDRLADLAARIKQVQELGGAVPSPFDCWLLLRSLATLPVRVRTQSATAMQIASFLYEHPRVHTVHYPGLPSHPGHAVASAQMNGFGGMLSFQTTGGADGAMRTAARVKLITRATSLGGVETLIEHRASVEGPDTPTPPDLLRLSVGLEHPDDLIADLRQALDA